MKKLLKKILPQLAGGGGPAARLVEGRRRRSRSRFPRFARPLHRTSCGPPPPASWGRIKEAGFTLVELMVVIVIIGLLATVVVINVMPATDRAALTKARADIATLEQGVEMYRLNKLTYPAAGEGLQAVVREGFVKRLPEDPWGKPYQYAAPGRDGRAFDIFSHGADGREGGEGEDADIGSWQS